MNKKRLSVVMAGAMLASSVAPVLAAEVKSYEVNGSNKGILIRDLRNLLTSKVFANVDANAKDTSATPARNKDYRGESVYSVEVGGKFYVNDIAGLEKALQDANANDIVNVYNRGFAEKNGKYYAYALEDMLTDAKFSEEDFTKMAKEFADDRKNNTTIARDKYPAIYNATYKDGIFTVEIRKAEGNSNLVAKTYKVGDTKLDFTKPVDKDGEGLTGAWNSDVWKDLDGFKKDETKKVEKGTDIPSELLATIKISDVDKVVNFELPELYDGLLLTEKGQELLDASKLCQSDAADGLEISNAAINEVKNGIFCLEITFRNNNASLHKFEKTLVKVTSNNKEQLALFRKWMVDAKAQVEVLAGSNRYETAVKVAKENASIKNVAKNGNIVLVNGEALVDGLAAAPLAAAVWNKNYTSGDPLDKQRVAPILLTESDSLPKATKEYMKELVKEQKVGQLNKVTVYLVGGTTVLSKNLENQLEDLGLRVVRAGGANREETSLKVAEVMQKDTKADLSNVFVVGAEGEADAMSIASVAADKKQPIIVESKKGLSEDAIDSLKDWKNSPASTTSVTIIGGETVVSKATEESLKTENVKVDRLGGSNRQATNAEIIDKFAKNGLNRIVISKDGQHNKKDLVDALTATSLAVKHHSPIVLGTNKLSVAQINALEKKADRNGIYVYQVGHGVARDVLKTIATRVGLAK